MSKLFNLVYRSVCSGYDFARLQSKNPGITVDLESIARDIMESENLTDFSTEEPVHDPTRKSSDTSEKSEEVPPVQHIPEKEEQPSPVIEPPVKEITPEPEAEEPNFWDIAGKTLGVDTSAAESPEEPEFSIEVGEKEPETKDTTDDDEYEAEYNNIPPEEVKSKVTDYLQSLTIKKEQPKTEEAPSPVVTRPQQFEKAHAQSFKEELRENLEEKFKKYHEEHPDLDAHPAEEDDGPTFDTTPVEIEYEPTQVETPPQDMPSSYTEILSNFRPSSEPKPAPVTQRRETKTVVEIEEAEVVSAPEPEAKPVVTASPVTPRPVVAQQVAPASAPVTQSVLEQRPAKEKLPDLNLSKFRKQEPTATAEKPIEKEPEKTGTTYSDTPFNLTGVVHYFIDSIRSDAKVKHLSEQGYNILPTDLVFLSTHQANRNIGIVLRLIDRKTGEVSYRYVIYELALNNGRGKVYNVTDRFVKTLPSLDKVKTTRAFWGENKQSEFEKEMSEISGAYIKDAFVDEMRSGYMKWLREQIAYRPTELGSVLQHMLKNF